MRPLVRRVESIVAGLATILLFAACSLAFPSSDLSAGDGATVAAGQGGAASSAGVQTSTTTALSSSGSFGGGGNGGTGGSCSAALCDDGNQCTVDSCGPNGCDNAIVAGAPCGKGNDCNAASSCSAAGKCIPGKAEAAKCDDKNDCTIDACEVSGCEHSPNTGAACNDGNSCHAAGTCNGGGKCAAVPVADKTICLSQVANCPGGYYISSIYCEPGCGSCSPFCVNAAKCSFSCGASYTACCGGGGCSAATCPAPYHVASAAMNVPQCACVPAPGVTCSL